MSESIVQPPTKEILGLCDHGDLLIGSYLACLNAKPRGWGSFEAEVEIYTILKLLLRHLESVSELARQDLVLLPSAVVIARAAFEAQVRARWMLKPVDPFEREVRWVLYLRSAAEHCGKLESNKHIPKQVGETYSRRRISYEQFDESICRLLTERGYKIPKQSPNVWEMLKDIGQPEFYQIYILLSAYTHTNFEAGLLYRKNLGDGKELGEFIAAKDWWLPLSVAWRSFYFVARDFLYWIETDAKTFKADELEEKFERLLENLLSA